MYIVPTPRRIEKDTYRRQPGGKQVPTVGSQEGRRYIPKAARREGGTYRRQPGGKEVPYHSKNVEGEEARDGHEVF